MSAGSLDLGRDRNPSTKRFAGDWALKVAVIPDREIGPAPSSLAVLETPRECSSRERPRLRPSYCILSVSLCTAVLEISWVF